MADVRNNHEVWHATEGMTAPLCRFCEEPWPCEVDRLRARLAEVEAERDRLRGMLDAERAAVEAYRAAARGESNQDYPEYDHDAAARGEGDRPAEVKRCATYDPATDDCSCVPGIGLAPPARGEGDRPTERHAFNPKHPDWHDPRCRDCREFSDHPIHSGEGDRG